MCVVGLLHKSRLFSVVAFAVQRVTNNLIAKTRLRNYSTKHVVHQAEHAKVVSCMCNACTTAFLYPIGLSFVHRNEGTL